MHYVYYIPHTPLDYLHLISLRAANPSLVFPRQFQPAYLNRQYVVFDSCSILEEDKRERFPYGHNYIKIISIINYSN